MEKKRKIDSECRKFKDQWNIQYFVIESSNKALCLICNESIAVLKEYNTHTHTQKPLLRHTGLTEDSPWVRRKSFKNKLPSRSCRFTQPFPLATSKNYNMKRHYETKHSQNYSKYTGIVRTEKFVALKRGLKSQQSLFTKVKTEQEAATRASFRVALEIA
ncbi:EPM2AIP1 [Cordylochernes scorpioides]|uniref:EPM2AIP1 n=1 Tax=Cordylochernes scorpioides TaxID=51811 RepID=A0ABY6LII5_9ARAC|nr:EPM2AIP1 [Cordylochernes scorpioides]